MDAEVRDDNPYSRLMALKRMGVVPNYEDIRLKSVLVVGVGGVGSVVCEMLTRCGIGKLIMYDYDRVEVANMNRLFFTPDQVGLSKVEAARQTLAKINPTVVVEAFDINISSNDGFAHIQEKIKTGGLDNDRVSLVLSCVDNYAARMTINSACNEDDQVWMESGVSEDAMSAHIQLIIPGETACFACATPVAVHDDNEATIKRPGVCAASLPTTMGITAGFLAQNTLKYLLNFGQTTSLLSYNALFDHFQNYAILPNTDCKDNHCRQRQVLNAEHNRLNALKREQKKEQVKHEQNEWGIEIIQEGQSEQKSEVQKDTEIISEQSLEQLMSQLKQL